MVIEKGMIGIVVGRWMVGIDWSRKLYLFVFDMESDDDVWRSKW
jgi:hypothetical protein